MIKNIKEFTDLYNEVAKNIERAKNYEFTLWNIYAQEVNYQGLQNIENVEFDKIDKAQAEWNGASIILDMLGIDKIKENRKELPRWYIQILEDRLAGKC